MDIKSRLKKVDPTSMHLLNALISSGSEEEVKALFKSAGYSKLPNILEKIKKDAPSLLNENTIPLLFEPLNTSKFTPEFFDNFPKVLNILHSHDKNLMIRLFNENNLLEKYIEAGKIIHIIKDKNIKDAYQQKRQETIISMNKILYKSRNIPNRGAP